MRLKKSRMPRYLFQKDEYSIQSLSTLESDEGGKALEGRIKLSNGRDAFEGIKFNVHLNCFVPEQEHHPDDPSARTILLEFVEVRLMAQRMSWSTALFTNADDYHHGVTLPPLVEHYLKGWGPDDLK